MLDKCCTIKSQPKPGIFWRQGLSVQPRLAFNLWPFYLSFQWVVISLCPPRHIRHYNDETQKDISDTKQPRAWEIPITDVREPPNIPGLLDFFLLFLAHWWKQPDEWPARQSDAHRNWQGPLWSWSTQSKSVGCLAGDESWVWCRNMGVLRASLTKGGCGILYKIPKLPKQNLCSICKEMVKFCICFGLL